MRRIDEYLSRKVQQVPAFERAMVYCDSSGPVENWTIERPGAAPPIGIGANFGTARRAILELRDAARGGANR